MRKNAPRYKSLDDLNEFNVSENVLFVAVANELFRMRKEMMEKGYLLWSQIPWIK